METPPFRLYPSIDSGMYGLYDRPIIAALVKGMQEQQELIAALRAEVNALKA